MRNQDRERERKTGIKREGDVTMEVIGMACEEW